MHKLMFKQNFIQKIQFNKFNFILKKYLLELIKLCRKTISFITSHKIKLKT